MNPQFKKGVLELCVLSLLRSKDRYGYELTETISKQMSVAAGTLYLLLKRLNDEGYFETYLVESESGPARKYYRLTDKGIEHENNLKNEWYTFIEQVDQHIKENPNE